PSIHRSVSTQYSLFCPPSCAAPRDLHSFPTRRSSDLAVPERPLGLSASSEDRELTRGLVLCDHEWLHDGPGQIRALLTVVTPPLDRKSTRLNSSHVSISYAVFCLKKKKNSRYKLAMVL